MGKCVRIRGSSRSKQTPPPAAAASCLTLRSGRRVPPVATSSAAACRPRTSGRPRRQRGSAIRWCGADWAKKSACGSPRRRTAADAAGSPPAGRVLVAQRLCHDSRRPEEEEEVPPGSGADAVARGVDGRGDSFDRRRPKPPPPMMTGDCDAAVEKAKAKYENKSRCRGVFAGQTPSQPPTEAEIEAFFAAAELAERRRFAEAYNYDVALDVPLEGRFEWEPLST